MLYRYEKLNPKLLILSPIGLVRRPNHLSDQKFRRAKSVVRWALEVLRALLEGGESLLQFKVVGRWPLSDLAIHLSNFLPCWVWVFLLA